MGVEKYKQFEQIEQFRNYHLLRKSSQHMCAKPGKPTALVTSNFMQDPKRCKETAFQRFESETLEALCYFPTAFQCFSSETLSGRTSVGMF